MSGIQVVERPPSPRLLDGYAALDWEFKRAIAEFVDNSFGFNHGNATTVNITYDQRARLLTVFDDGEGMRDPCDLFQLGQGAPPDPRDIGRYGQGGSIACVWLSDTPTVETVRIDGSWAWARADQAAMQMAGRWQLEIRQEAMAPSDAYPPLALLGHGTVIRCRIRTERGTLFSRSVKEALAELYGPALREGRRITWNGVALTPTVPPATAQPLEVTLWVEGRQLRASGQVWIDPDSTVQEWGLDIAFKHRVILPHNTDAFRRTDGRSDYMGQHIRGHLALGDGFGEYLTTTKEDIYDQNVRQALILELARHLEPLLKRQEQTTQTMRNHALNIRGTDMLASLVGDKLTIGGQPVGTRAPTRYTWSKQDKQNPPKTEIERKIPGPLPGDGPAGTRAGIRFEFLEHKKMGGKVCFVKLGHHASDLTVFVDRDSTAVHEFIGHRRAAVEAIVVAHITNELVHLDTDALQYWVVRKHAKELLTLSGVERYARLFTWLCPVESRAQAARSEAE